MMELSLGIPGGYLWLDILTSLVVWPNLTQMGPYHGRDLFGPHSTPTRT